MEYYGSLEYYNTLLESYGIEKTNWDEMDDRRKQRTLERLSRDLDHVYMWIGEKKELYQVLQFPRDFSKIYMKGDLRDIYFKNQGLVPNELLDCMFELLLIELAPEQYEKLFDRGIKSINDGVLSVTLNKSKKSTNYLVDKYLRDFSTIGYSVKNR